MSCERGASKEARGSIKVNLFGRHAIQRPPVTYLNMHTAQAKGMDNLTISLSNSLVFRQRCPHLVNNRNRKVRCRCGFATGRGVVEPTIGVEPGACTLPSCQNTGGHHGPRTGSASHIALSTFIRRKVQGGRRCPRPRSELVPRI